MGIEGKQVVDTDCGETGDVGDGGMTTGVEGTSSKFGLDGCFGVVGLVIGGVGGISPVMFDRDWTTWTRVIMAPIADIDMMSQSELWSSNGSSSFCLSESSWLVS